MRCLIFYAWTIDCPVNAQQSHVAWQYDVQHLYGPVQPVNYNTEQLAGFRGGNTSDVVLNQNQHFIVWMRPAAQPTFRKLWAVIEEPLLAGGSLLAPFVFVTALGCCPHTK